jgi:guanine deaminase
MKPRTQFIHAIWLNPRELELIADAGVSLQHNPSVNLMVGSGLMPIREVLDAGINLSMGTDGCGSIETCDMHKALFAGALLQKLRGWEHTRWVGAEEIWRAATMGGALALGRGDELGAIEVGRRADLTAYRLDGIQLTPLNNPVRQLVYAETGRNLDAVFVDGEAVMRDGELCSIDEGALIAEIQEAHRELLPQLTASRAEVDRMVAPMERIYRRCQEMPIADDTFPARLPS